MNTQICKRCIQIRKSHPNRTHLGDHLLGKIVEGEMVENQAGELVRKIWREIPDHYPEFKIDNFIVMPNHFHGILIKDFVGAGPCACPNSIAPRSGATTGSRPYNLSLFDVMERFKSLTTIKYLEGIDQFKWLPFNGKLWQRNYYDHIIRNEKELNAKRNYILNNPSNWEEDEYFDQNCCHSGTISKLFQE